MVLGDAVSKLATFSSMDIEPRFKVSQLEVLTVHH